MKLILAISLITFSSLLLHAQKPSVGIAQEMRHDSLLYASGYVYLVESIANIFSPRNITNEQFAEKLKAIRKMKMELYAVNIFIPGELKLVGPHVDDQATMQHVEVVFSRCREAGVKLIVWGSGGARRVPDGFDKGKAREQFIAIAKKISTLAGKYNITLALENLNSGETNFINKFEEALEIAEQVNHPNFRICADIYHMLKENEPPAVIERAGKYLVHCDLAEKDNRAAPGTSGDDFREYLKALKKVDYTGKIILECRWDNLTAQALPALQALQTQIGEVYSQK